MADIEETERAYEDLMRLASRVGRLAIRGSLDDFQKRDIASQLHRIADSFDTAPDEAFERQRTLVEEAFPALTPIGHGTLVTSGGHINVDNLVQRLVAYEDRIANLERPDA